MDVSVVATDGSLMFQVMLWCCSTMAAWMKIIGAGAIQYCIVPERMTTSGVVSSSSVPHGNTAEISRVFTSEQNMPYEHSSVHVMDFCCLEVLGLALISLKPQGERNRSPCATYGASCPQQCLKPFHMQHSARGYGVFVR